MQRLILLAILFVCLAPNPAYSQVKIVGEKKYSAHSLVRLRAENVDPKSALLWRIYPSKDVHRATNPRGVLEFSAHPGTYEVELLVISKDGDNLSVEEARISVVIEGCTPVPPSPMPPSPMPPSPLPPDKKERIDPVNAIVRIQFGTAGCSATIVSPRRSDGRWDILTAAHCIENVGDRGVMILPENNKRYPVRVVTRNKTSDVAWLVTEDSVPDLPCAKLADREPEVGVKVWHKGFGVDKPGNREDGEVAEKPNAFGQTRFILSVSSGDSGGGIFRDDTNELISTVCCTSRMAQKASMWGGSVDQVKKHRPTGALSWEPIPDAKKNAPWEPINIPIRKLFRYGDALVLED
jgi:hypothetical protein